MPADFDACVSSGGRVRTVTGPSDEHGLKDGEYVRYCYDKAGKAHRGEVRHMKKGTEKPHTFHGSVTELGSLLERFDETSRVSEIEILKVGSWNHPMWGEIEITPERLQRFYQNFNDGVRKAVPIDVEHKSDDGAVGWVTHVRIDADRLMAEVEWTEEGANLIKGKKYRFFSPEYADEYEDPATGAEYMDVLIGGAITNRPFFQELEEIVLSERGVMTKKFAEWTTAYVNDLPDSAFLYVEPGGDKDEEGRTKPRSLRHFPYKDADGKVDLPHLRNALARIPQSSLPEGVKDSVAAKARKIAESNGIDVSKEGGENNMEKCEECGKMIKKTEMADHMKEEHKKMALTREELKAKVLEDPSYKPTEEEGVSAELLAEVQAEVKKEAGAGGGEGEEGGEGGEGGEGDGGGEGGTKTGTQPKGKTVKMSEDQLKKLEVAANEGVKAMRELRAMKIAEVVAGFTFSEKNAEGVILPKTAEKVKALMMSLGDKQREALVEILKGLPKVRLFSEIGSDTKGDEPIEGDPYAELNRRAKKLMAEEPEKYKNYRDAAYAAEKQMKEEGVDFTQV